MRHFVITAGLACALAFPATSGAQNSAQPPAKPQTTKPETSKPHETTHAAAANGVAAADQSFAKHAAIGGMAEVDLGQLAASKATNPDVKQFGQRMVDDHGKGNDELKSWASQKNVTLPADLDAKHKAEHARLDKLSGDAFDRAYMTLMVADHNEDVAEFQRESKSAKDPDLKAWAAKTLPTLQDHQKSAKEISGKLHGTAAKPAAPKKSGGGE